MPLRAEVVATGIRFAEGPVWCADDASVVCTSVADGALYRVPLATGTPELVANVGGGANAAQHATDGGFVVTQNGGIDFSQMGLYRDDPPPYRPATPGIQRVDAAGAVSYVIDDRSLPDGLLAPNDLVVAANGTLYFTDPPQHPPPPEKVGRVHALRPDGTVETVARGFLYCNGIALEPDGGIVVVEGPGLQRVRLDGTTEWIVEELEHGTGDGFCVDVDGRFYVASTTGHGVAVVEPDGTEVDWLALEGRGLTTNCCFGGADHRTLFATDAMPGNLVAWEGMDTPGLPQLPWPVT